LAVIAQSVEPIRRALPPSEAGAARSLQLIERSVVKLDAMVSAQRDLDHTEADLIYPTRQPMDLSRFLRDLVPGYEAALAGQGKRLIALVEPQVEAFANEDLMEPVIENLLENAASFTPPGGAIEISLGREDGKVRLSVLDQGPGVRPRLLPHIFERNMSFRDQQESEPNQAGGHQGLGLWIVRRNVEGLGGSVSARNLTRGGFEVTVSLPSA
jgi:two-component system sensor histidine kinase ChvG